MSAIRAATAGPRALGGDGQKARVVARDLFDAAARHRTELVHAPFYGVRCVILQTSGLDLFNPRKERESPRSGGFCKEPKPPRRVKWHTDDPGDGLRGSIRSKRFSA